MTKLTKPLAVSLTSAIDNKKRKEVTLPGVPAKDFIVTARCRIVSVRAQLIMTAADLPDSPDGTFKWSSDSRKIRLENTSGPKLLLTALSEVSSARDSEIVTVTRRAPDGSEISKTVAITVARVVFAASPNQRYGFDDNDTPVDDGDNHISVASRGITFLAVTIEGGVDSDDFDFQVENGAVITVEVPPSSTKFDLKIVAANLPKASARLLAVVKCLSKACFAEVRVHVYEKRIIKVIIGQFFDSQRAGTALKLPNRDFKAEIAKVNDSLREAAVELQIEYVDDQFRVENLVLKETVGDALVYEMGSPPSGMALTLEKRFSGYRGYIKVAIAGNVDFVFRLKSPAVAGNDFIQIENMILLPQSVQLGRGAVSESVSIKAIVGENVKLTSPLLNSYPTGTELIIKIVGVAREVSVISEATADKNGGLIWVIAHEVLHRALGLTDIVDTSNIMNHENDFVDHRLRFSPRKYARKVGEENQWEIIDRSPKPKF